MPTDFEFSQFDNIEPPTNLAGVVAYGSGSYSANGARIAARVYSYKVVGGKNVYSKKHASAFVTPNSSASPFTVTWSWTASVDSPYGYLVDYRENTALSTTVAGLWQVTTSTSFADDGSTVFDPFSLGRPRAKQNPVDCALFGDLTYPTGKIPGPWLRELDRIRSVVFDTANYPTRGLGWIVSDASCVSVGPKLRFGDASGSVDYACYQYPAYYYALSDWSGNVDFDIVAEGGTVDNQQAITNTSGVNNNGWVSSLDFAIQTSSTIRTAVGRVTFTTTTSAADIGTVLSVGSGTVTINTQTWSRVGNVLTVDFKFTFTSDSASISISITLGVGNVFDDALGTGQTVYCDITVGNESVAPVTTGVGIVHPSSLGAKAARNTDIDSTLDPVTFNGGALPVCYKIRQGMDGVWVSETYPVFGVNSFIQNDLPNYYINPATGYGSSAQGIAETSPPGATQVVPAASNRGAGWPVRPAYDFGSWNRLGNSPWSGRPAPYYSFDPFHAFFFEPMTATPGQFVQNFSGYYVLSNYSKLILRTSDTTLEIYAGTSPIIDTSNPSTYGAHATGELRIPTAFSFSGGSTLYFGVKNNTLSTKSFDFRIIACYKDDSGSYPGDLPVFFRTLTSGQPDLEVYSYKSASSVSGAALKNLPTPTNGQLLNVWSATRQPVEDSYGIATVPTSGPNLVVKLGLMLGFTFDNSVAFTELASISLTSGIGGYQDGSLFLPVVSGATMAYVAYNESDLNPLSGSTNDPVTGDLLYNWDLEIPDGLGGYTAKPSINGYIRVGIPVAMTVRMYADPVGGSYFVGPLIATFSFTGPCSAIIPVNYQAPIEMLTLRFSVPSVVTTFIDFYTTGDYPVEVTIGCNFQPAVISEFYPPPSVVGVDSYGNAKGGRYCGVRQPLSQSMSSTGIYRNDFPANGRTYQPDIITLPVSARVFNETEFVLGVI